MSLKRRDVRRNHNDNAARRLNDPADDKGNTPKRPARLAALRRLRGTAAACAGVAAGVFCDPRHRRALATNGLSVAYGSKSAGELAITMMRTSEFPHEHPWRRA
jgi:hypothetical protein